MFNIGPPEIVLVLVVALLVFGPARLPQLGRSLGRGLREFRKASEEIRSAVGFDVDPDLAPRHEPGLEPQEAPASASSGGGGPDDDAGSDVLAGEVVEEPEAPGPAASGGPSGAV